MTRDELLRELKAAHDESSQAIAGLAEADLTRPGVMEGWSVQDVFDHVAIWEAEVLKALGQARMGKRPTINDLTDAEIEEQNQQWLKASKKKPLDKVLADHAEVRRQMIKQVEKLTDADLSATGGWLKNDTLATFIAEEIIGHERDHLPHLLEWRKRVGGETA